MNFYLGVWNSPTAISNDEAAARYSALSDEKDGSAEFDDQVYVFYSRLTSQYRKSKWLRKTNSMLVPGPALST